MHKDRFFRKASKKPPWGINAVISSLGEGGASGGFQRRGWFVKALSYLLKSLGWEKGCPQRFKRKLSKEGSGAVWGELSL